MLTAITLQNFKGIGDPVTIPIRPLTILFGKNSAGKSTVVQALHYAREVLLNNNPNADRTALGGTSIDLGGFRSLVHKHEYLSRSIVMRFDFDVSGQEFPEYQDWNTIWEYGDAGYNKTKTNADPDPEFINYHQGKNLYNELQKYQSITGLRPSDATSSGIEFTVKWSEVLDKPVVTNYRTWLGGEEAGRITTSIDCRNFVWEINLNNRFLVSDPDEDGLSGGGLEALWETVPPLPHTEFRLSVPEWGKPVYISPFSDFQNNSIGYNTVSQLMTGPGEMLIGYLDSPGLKDLRYIGPLREIPPRNFSPTNLIDESLWSNGLAAWTRLLQENRDLVLNVGEWLGSDRLKTGYTLERNRYREIPIDSELMLGLQNGDLIDRIDDTATAVKEYPIRENLAVVEERTGVKLLPYDIGIGISQVIPIVVAAFDSFHQFVAVEQPELHLHPAVQAELGDLFITSANELHNVFFLETHSEHLILRVLRRIRETEAGEIAEKELKIHPDDVSLVYVEPRPNGTEFLMIPITNEGDLEKNVPGGFFAERAEELF